MTKQWYDRTYSELRPDEQERMFKIALRKLTSKFLRLSPFESILTKIYVEGNELKAWTVQSDKDSETRHFKVNLDEVTYKRFSDDLDGRP